LCSLEKLDQLIAVLL